MNRKRGDLIAGDRNTSDSTPAYTGIYLEVTQDLHGQVPTAFFRPFIDDDIMALLVTQMNRFATQNIASASGAGNETNKTRMIK